MSKPLTLAQFRDFAQRIADVDSVAAFDEACFVDFAKQQQVWLTAGALALYVVRGDALCAQLAVAPESRRQGLGTKLVRELASRARSLGLSRLLVWGHGDSPARQRFAKGCGFTPQRVLQRQVLQLQPQFSDSARLVVPPVSPAPQLPPGFSVRSFDPLFDLENFVALNAAVFADHPEQGLLTAADVQARLAQPATAAANLLLLCTPAKQLAGFCWLKTAPQQAEIYVLGVSKEHAGRGLGAALLARGLQQLAAGGAQEVELYVEAQNTAATALYSKYGFQIAQTHTQYALQITA